MTDTETEQPAINLMRRTTNGAGRPVPKYFFFSLQGLALALFVIAYSASLRAQGNATTGSSGQLQAGQMPYFDAVPDPLDALAQLTNGDDREVELRL